MKIGSKINLKKWRRKKQIALIELTYLWVPNVDYDIASQTKALEHFVIVCTNHCVFSFQAQCSVTKKHNKRKKSTQNIIHRQIWYTYLLYFILILVKAAQKCDNTAKRSIMPNNGWKKVGWVTKRTTVGSLKTSNSMHAHSFIYWPQWWWWLWW